MRTILVATLLAVLSGVPASAADEPGDPGFVLHEWGTFTTVAGSDGVLLDGVHADDHALPSFVHARDGERDGFSGASVKMETPVIYLYSDREREVRLKVRFPGGLLTTWYPQVRFTAPAVGAEPPALRDGILDWGTVKVVPPEIGLDRLPATEPGDPWELARGPRSNVLRICAADGAGGAEHERYLFYRGLGKFDLPLRVSATDGRVVLRGLDPEGGAEARLLRVENGKIRTGVLRRVPGAKAPEHALDFDELKEATVEEVVEALVDAYTRQGLTRDEALAMVRTWENSWLRSPGTRVLVALPRPAVDAILPLEVDPAPRETVRVLVARLDVLTPAEERRAESVARDAATAEDAARSLGRFAAPVLRRVARTAADPETAARAGVLARTLEPAR